MAVKGTLRAATQLLKRDAELEIDLGDAGKGFAEDGDVEGEEDGDPKPKKEEERDDVFRPPIAILGDAVGAAEGVGDGGDEHRAEINAEDDARGGERAAAPGDDDVCHHAVENFLHFRVGREKSANDAEHFVQRRGVGAEEAEEMPEEEETGRERKEELVGHLGRKAERLVGRGLPDEAAHDSAG